MEKLGFLHQLAAAQAELLARYERLIEAQEQCLRLVTENKPFVDHEMAPGAHEGTDALLELEKRLNTQAARRDAAHAADVLSRIISHVAERRTARC